MTQEFFARLLANKFLSAVRKERGKFRWFLLSALQRFLTNEWHYAHAAKRGGGCQVISLDQETAENRYLVEIGDDTTPETLFNRNWAVTVLEQAQRQLQEEYTHSNRGPLFERFKVFLSGDRAPMTLAEAGAALGMGEGAAKVAVHRLRQRYRECLREQIAQTVSSPAEVDEEIRHLFAVFAV